MTMHVYAEFMITLICKWVYMQVTIYYMYSIKLYNMDSVGLIFGTSFDSLSILNHSLGLNLLILILLIY